MKTWWLRGTWWLRQSSRGSWYWCNNVNRPCNRLCWHLRWGRLSIVIIIHHSGATSTTSGAVIRGAIDFDHAMAVCVSLVFAIASVRSCVRTGTTLKGMVERTHVTASFQSIESCMCLRGE